MDRICDPPPGPTGDAAYGIRALYRTFAASERRSIACRIPRHSQKGLFKDEDSAGYALSGRRFSRYRTFPLYREDLALPISL